LTFDLTLDYEKLSTKKHSQGKRGRNLESNRGGSLARMDRRIDVM